MEHDSSFNKQLRKEITDRAVMNTEIKMLEDDIDENIQKKNNVDIEYKNLYLNESEKVKFILIFFCELLS